MLFLSFAPWISIFAVAQLAKYFNEKGRIDRIETVARLDRQLELYGGLWARLYTSRQIFIDFVQMEGFHYPEELSIFKEAIDTQPNSAVAKRYRTIMQNILGPNQIETIDMAISSFSLLRDGKCLPELLLEYFAMVNNYKIIISRWESNDFSLHFSSRKFPHDLLEYLEQEFVQIKSIKARLLGRKFTDHINSGLHTYTIDVK